MGTMRFHGNDANNTRKHGGVNLVHSGRDEPCIPLARLENAPQPIGLSLAFSFKFRLELARSFQREGAVKCPGWLERG